MRQIKYIIFLLFLFSSLVAQNKRDYNWLFGSSPYLDQSGVKGNLVDFNSNGKIDTIKFGDAVASNNINISDLEGDLLFYFNGCRVIDSTHQIMENGDSLNYGEAWETFCPAYARYPGIQNSIALPDPGNEKGYYLIHKRTELVTEPIVQTYTPELYCSYIDMNKNEGKGEVVEKNKPIFRTSNIVNGYLTACKHANGEDWWLIQMKRESNMYFKVLLTADTIMAVDSQEIGTKYTSQSNVGQAVFTPDGSKWVSYDNYDGARIIDFDRESGQLSNFRQIEVQDSGRFVGIAVSPNSRFAYLASKWDLYQIDLWEEDIASTLTHIDHWDGFTDPTFASTFNLSQLAPDCKIYIVSSSTNNYLHIINRPNRKGKDCNFKQHTLKLPKRNYNNSIPNFPHFRIDEENICDSTITWIPEKFIVSRAKLKIYPNPSNSSITIRIDSDIAKSSTLRIFNTLGRQLEQIKLDPWIKNYTWIPDPGFSGLYFVICEVEGRMLGREKGVVVE